MAERYRGGSNAGPRGPMESRSVRLYDDAWREGQERAKREGTNLMAVMRELLEGYADGELDLDVSTLRRVDHDNQ